MLSITKRQQQDSVAALQKALSGGTEDEIKQAWEQFHESIVASVRQDYEEASGNHTILAQRGYRQLTKEEHGYYEKLIQAGKEANPQQAMTNLLSNEIMPSTIIEDVYKDLIEEHPLLSKINFQNVKYLTRWILNDHSKQSAVWGELNSTITQEITSGFKTIEINQCKLTAFTVIEKDMLDLGPTFLDGYIRTFLKEALLCGLEKAIVDGTGKSCPIGLSRDIHEGVSVTDGVYPRKAPVAVTSFEPKEYGALLAGLVKTEKGKIRKFEKVLMICNQVDYLTKIMPATTVLNGAGAYVNNLFPFPTEVVISNELATGEAIVCLPEEYFMGIGGSKEGVIEYSDDFKFLEDKRVFKIKMYGKGKAYDNTAALLLNIAKLDPAYITVKNYETPVV
ncbi:phage major capsid protein [Anaerosacchariphilus polymeriproducens]|uniref:Phage major capsid protein n=1 Tax=Anaerosacchariphilus polymeriproducens TaxID=1812858 RepID=A0A371ARM9_9FIRM|nr:phage major capsid protein [Anaerosacchariphilus polymeriproducens]RDU22204.1 phage major capsid protein [Anaerosacchariphilus polymeriproducens]